jgi:hypothetical protein
VSGIGFLGAGAILARGEIVRGLTTAASIWTVAARGALTPEILKDALKVRNGQIKRFHGDLSGSPLCRDATFTLVTPLIVLIFGINDAISFDDTGANITLRSSTSASRALAAPSSHRSLTSNFPPIKGQGTT